MSAPGCAGPRAIVMTLRYNCQSFVCISKRFGWLLVVKIGGGGVDVRCTAFDEPFGGREESGDLRSTLTALHCFCGVVMRRQRFDASLFQRKEVCCYLLVMRVGRLRFEVHVDRERGRHWMAVPKYRCIDPFLDRILCCRPQHGRSADHRLTKDGTVLLDLNLQYHRATDTCRPRDWWVYRLGLLNQSNFWRICFQLKSGGSTALGQAH